MNFDKLDKEMRIYEQSLDQCVLPGMHLLARIDGRSFTRLTKEICNFEAPFDIRFRDIMAETVKSLMDCGFNVVYGFTESDEISLLFHDEEKAFGRKVRKYDSVLAGQASAAFSMILGKLAVFDCRVIQIPTMERVIDYFQWRQEDAHRNALNSHCYWLLRKQGATVQQATRQLIGKSIAYKNELLFHNGINFNELPSWQKRGIGFYWANLVKKGFNPALQIETETTRREIAVNYELPIKKKYEEFLTQIIVAANAKQKRGKRL
ncbi:MAG: hypothetical protein J5706_08145 [Elusimicrobiales bacterium]|nr:hypothetical protein [Elusimicrobiales bacterium]